MNFRFVRDLHASPDDSIFNTFGDDIYASFIPLAGNEGGNLVVNTFFGMSPTPSFWSQGTSSTSVQSVPNSVVAVTSGGITINLLFDAAAMAAPASFRAGIQQAAAILAATISDKITVNLSIDYSGTGGGAAAGPDHGLFESYTSIRTDLINNATPGDTTFNALPSGSSIQGQSSVAVWNAQLKLWGLLGANDTTTDDGSATFATDIGSSLLVGVALHELTHALGRIPYGSQPDIFDLFRFTSAGTRLFSGGSTAPAAYFSVDGGHTKLADYGQNSDPSDFLNSGVQGPNDPFNEFYTGSTSQVLTTVDKELLDALGFHTASPVTTVIEAFGSTSLIEVGNQFYLYNSGGSGPSLKLNGANVVAGQFGAVAPIGAEQTAGGYEVAWKSAGTDFYTVWFTDSNGSYISNIGTVSGPSYALESLESSFHQDLNGDGVIGPVTTVIEANGSTSLIEVGNQFYLYNSSGSDPSLKLNGANVVAGQFGAVAPISAEQTAGGYEVAWKSAGIDFYTVWFTDSNGSYISNIGTVSGSSYALESLESSFHQDLNGDGVIGPVIGVGATLELTSADPALVTFSSSTGMLKLDAPSTFTGQIVGFSGDGTLSGSDQIDLLNINFGNSIQFNSIYNSSSGLLEVSDGTTVDLLHFIGSYSQANFKFASDGHGGTIVYDPPTTSQSTPVSVGAANEATIYGSTSLNGDQVIVNSGATLMLGNVAPAGATITSNGTVNIFTGEEQDTFVFTPNFGQAIINHFTPGADTIQINAAVFANIDALLAATHDDQHGNAVITDVTHDTITIQNVTAAQLYAHQADFHFV